MAPLRPFCSLRFHKACSDHGTLSHPSFAVQRVTYIYSLFPAFSNTTGDALLVSFYLILSTFHIPLFLHFFACHAALPTDRVR